MEYSAAASHKPIADSVSSHIVKSSSVPMESLILHKLPDLGASSSCSNSSKRIKCFYMIDHCWNKDPFSFTCFALNKENGETTTWTISPASGTKPIAISLNFTAVALGSNIFMIGGLCHPGLCPDGRIGGSHWHAYVRYFNTLRPEDGWMHAAPMHFERMEPAAVVIDGMIYVFGGLDREAPDDGECFDPNTNQWHRFSAKGCRPSFACIQAPYIDRNGAKSILVHSDVQNVDTLYAFLLDTWEWKILSRHFICQRPGAILDDVIYAVLDDDDEEQPLHGYDLIHNRWLPVDLPELDAGTEICTETVCVFTSGSDKLCLLWYHIDVDGRGKHSRMECLEIRLYKSYSCTGVLLNLTASKVSHTYYRVQYRCIRKSILAL
ncbi:hypothetical protein OROGR_033308 [Orobanche gracilis]